MLWSKRQWKVVKFLASKFEVSFPHDVRSYQYEHPYDFLEILERKLTVDLAERGEEYFHEMSEEVVWAVNQLTYSELASMSYGIDYNLELRRETPIISEENYPTLFYCLVSLPRINNEGLVNENHGKGYHIHYVVMQKQRRSRTNIVFTFNPSEISHSQHVLYWEHHGSGLSREPDRFGKRRRNAIYDTSCGFLSKVPKNEFKAPDSAANVLWPQ